MYGMKMGPLKIGIDLDDTITAAPELFRDLIAVFKSHGCQIYIVTARNEGDRCATLKAFEPLVDGVIFTHVKAKMECAEIDIWIDDYPLAITHDFKGARFVPCETLKKEKWIKECDDDKQ